MNSVCTLRYALLASCLLVGCYDTAVGQSFALQNPDGSPVTSITQNIASGQLMAPVPFKVVSATPGTEYSVTLSLNIPATFPYFLLSQTTGQTPLSFNLYQQAIAPDRTYTGQLTVSSSTAGTTPPVPITINVGVAGTGTLTSNPASLTFSTPPGTNPPGQFLTVTAPKNAVVSFNVTASTVTGGTWLQVFPTTNVQTGPSVNNNVTVSVNTSGLTFGTYQGTVTLTPTAGGTATTVPVTLDLTGLPTLNFTPTQLGFAYQTGTSVTGLVQTLTFSTDSTASLFYTLNVQYGSGTPGWLVVVPLGGTVSKGADSTNTVSVAPGALAPGTYSATIQVTATGASNPTQSIPVTLLVSNNPLLQIGTPPPPFNYQIGGTIPDNQTITIGSSSSALAFTTAVSYDTASGSNQWLTVKPGSGTTPATLSLSVNPTKLPAGKYIATVTVTSPSAGNPPQQFQVVLNVSAVTMLTTQANTLTFNYQTGERTPGSQQVQVGSTGAPLTFAASASSASCGGAWLSVLPVVGTTPATLSVSVLPGGIAPVTTCTGTISIMSPDALVPATITTLLNVSDQPLLNVVQTGLVFTVNPGSSTSSPQFISITSTDPNTALPYAAVASVGPGQGNWLLLGSGAGATPGNVSVYVNPGTLGPGTYAGTVIVTSPNAPTNYNIPIVLNVLSSISAVSSPPLVNLVQAPGSTTAVSEPVQISASNGGALGFNVFTSTSSGGNWLSATPAGATTPASITVTANSNGQLSQGVYNGTVTIQMPGADNSPLNIPVTLTVGTANTFTLTPTSVSFTGTVGGPNPQPQTVQVAASAPTSNITVSTATTTCGGAWFSVAPQSGTAPLTLTITPNLSSVTGAATCTGTVTVSSPGFASAAVDVTLNAVATAITKVQNAASFVFGAVSPGELVYLEGTNLGPDTLVPLTLDANGNVSTQLDDTEVLFDGQPAPLVYVSATKITAIVPYEVSGKQTTSIQVNHAGVVSTAIAQPVAATAPGIFTANASGAGQASAVNIKADGSFSYNGPACAAANQNCGTEPAPVGSVVVVYGTGEGFVAPLPATGSVTGTTNLPVIVAPVTIKLGGVPLDPSDVLYAGPAPTFAAGVIQINFRIPQGYNPGPTPVQAIIGDNVGNSPTVVIGPAQ
jgi:uncharacterized protein (TIGR03437 family)